ncbi:hypothetical protein ACP8HI_12495 [Paenibacillus sp. FA6]|uniref:hypothetical protein n=1 Tax=Paenibacillus sp. FA6 TaxID=3413029 RepID=UPI003F65AA46
MSLCISASKEKEHYIAVDTAISFKYKGISYRNKHQTTDKKLIIIDNEAYFFAGDVDLVMDLQGIFKQQDNRSFEKLTELGKNLFENHADDGDELAFSKYGFTENGLAYAQCTSNWLKFIPTDRHYGHKNNSFMAYGSNMGAASKLIDLRTVNITPDFFIPIYEGVADEGVGHSIFVYHLTPNKCGKTEEILLTEPDTIRKSNPNRILQHFTFVGSGNDAFPVQIFGEGDGAKSFDSNNPISPEMASKPMSGKGFVTKPKGSFDMLYYNSNYGKERSLRLMDDEVLMKAENSKIHMVATNYEIEADQGGVKITLSNGTSFELTPDGDVTLHAKKDVKVSADGNVQINAQKYDFV